MDPITIGLMMAANIGGSMYSNSQAKKAMQAQLGFANREMADAEKGLSGLGDIPKYELGSAYQKYISAMKEDPASDFLRKEQLQREANTIAALKGGGAKAVLGGAQKMSSQAAAEREQIEIGASQRQQQALGEAARLQQGVADRNVALEQQQYMAEQQRLRGRQDAAQQAIYDAQLARITGQGQMGQAIGQTIATGIGQMGKNGMVTPGEFSHETNPIDLVRNGEKVGEATGGEVILNPEQSKAVSKESPEFRRLLRKFTAKAMSK
ncbi:MAG: hypothetical protein CMI60_16240 [Parvibaculum sp.]|nr:hypothetical protein [Parvibaculum sp.]